MAEQTNLFRPGGKLAPVKSSGRGVVVTDAPKRGKTTLLDKVREVLSDGHWRASFDVQAAVDKRYGTYASDSSITARLRELRQVGCTVEVRRVKGKNYSEYRLVIAA